MECDKIRNLIIPYIYKELTLKKLKKFENHLSVCQECKTLIKDYKMILENVDNNSNFVPSQNLDFKILAKARQNTSFKNRLAHRKKPLKPFYPSWALAAALVGVVMIIWHFSPFMENSFVPQIAQNLQKQNQEKFEKSKIGISKLSRDNNNSPIPENVSINEMSLSDKSNQQKIEIKEEPLIEDPYNKHPFGPYDDNTLRIDRVPAGVDFASYQHKIGLELKNQGRCQDANYIFDRIIREFPKYTRIRKVYIDSADCYSKMGKKYDAVTRLEMYLEKFPQEEEVIKKLIEEIEKK